MFITLLPTFLEDKYNRHRDMASEVECYGKEAIMRCFDLHNKSNYAVFAGNGGKWQIKFQCINEPMQEARSILEQNITAIDPLNDATYQVRFYPESYEKDEVTTGTEFSSSFNFKVKPKTSYPGEQMQGTGPIASNNWYERMFFEKLIKEKDELEQELAQAYERIDELEALVGDDEEENPVNDIISGIGYAGDQYPWMQQHFGKLIEIFDNLTGGLKNNQNSWTAPPPKNDNRNNMQDATQVQEKFKKAIEKLISYYRTKHGVEKGDELLANDLTKLADKTDNQAQFETLRNFL